MPHRDVIRYTPRCTPIRTAIATPGLQYGSGTSFGCYHVSGFGQHHDSTLTTRCNLHTQERLLDSSLCGRAHISVAGDRAAKSRSEYRRARPTSVLLLCHSGIQDQQRSATDE
ncbi:hypothetical protein BDW22DRAFT_711965 [Trametopsis cervina]|nr:hypothetical protein BDW22DRAFT_711965 [Trametopsis cervina]